MLMEYDLDIKPTNFIKGQGLAKLMAQSNCEIMGINFIIDLSIDSEEERVPRVSKKILDSTWYADIIYVLRNLQAPPKLRKTKARFLRIKATQFCILYQSLYWKDPGGIFLCCLLEEEVEKNIREFDKGDCGGHCYWKTTVHKILRAGFYWPSIFFDVYKEVSIFYECHIFYGKRKLQPFPLNPISVEEQFMQWGLDFIGEIHP
jgi:hypothetical protein